MRFRFIGRYTNGHTSINACGVIFEGHEPAEVPAEALERLSHNIEFEAVVTKAEPVAMSVVDDPASFAPVVPVKKRGRPRKAAE